MSRYYYRRDDNIKHIGDDYFPDGLPQTDDTSDRTSFDFEDENGKIFHIVYTEKQILEHAKKNFGLWEPYFPLAFCE
jgi:hypothetical protein